MGAAVRFERVHPQGEVERWRQRGYEAVDCMVKRLQGEKDCEAMSELLGREGRRLTGAIFEEVIKSRGGERKQPRHACMRRMRSDAKTPEPIAHQDGGKPAWRDHNREALFLL